jgi:hypothetical protein
MRKLALGVAGLAGIMASSLAITPAGAVVGNVSSALRTTQSIASVLTPVHCRLSWHCHPWGCHRCGRYSRPVITGFAGALPCEIRLSHINPVGRRFGTAPHGERPPDRRLAAGGHGVHVDLETVWWSDTEIEAIVPDDPRLQGGQWYYVGIEKADHSAWLSNINKIFVVCAP